MTCTQHLELSVVGMFEVRIGQEYRNGCLACPLQQLCVERRIGNLQIECHTTLLCAVYVAGTAQLKVELRQTESVGGLTHSLQSLAGFA